MNSSVITSYIKTPSVFKKIRSSIIGIALSLIPLIVVLHISDGMIQGITSRLMELSSYHFQVRGNSDIDFQGARELLEKRDDVNVMIRERQGVGILYAPDGGRTGVTIRGVDADAFAADKGFHEYIEIKAGSFDLHSDKSVVIGAEVAKQLGVDIGDKVKLLSIRSFRSSGIIPRISSFEVSGIVATGYQDIDKLWVYMPLERARRILSDDTSIDLLGVKIENPFDDPYALKLEIQTDLPRGDRIYTWQELERNNYRSFETTRYLLILIMALIVVVAMVNISSGLVLLVIEKREEVAVMKSFGASPRQIRSIFRRAGLVAGVIGTCAGIFIGLIISVGINEIVFIIESVINFFSGTGGVNQDLVDPSYYLEEIPVVIRWGEVGLAALFSVAVSVLAALLPARSAAKIKPLEVLRKQ